MGNGISKNSSSLIPSGYSNEVYLAVDDKLVEKIGKLFGSVSCLFDHSAHDDNKYINGHCVVCVLMFIPILVDREIKYIKFPVAFRLWKPTKTDINSSNDKLEKKKKKRSAKKKDKKMNDNSKLYVAKRICEQIRSVVEPDRNIIILADAWYPKGPMRDFVVSNKNVGGVFNVRIDTAIYALPVHESGKRGRPPKKGKKLSIDSDFGFIEVPNTEYKVAYCRGVTHLFGLDNEVLIVVTEKGQSRRLFICTDPGMITIGVHQISDSTAKAIGTTLPELICFCAYSFRWGIAVTFQETKSFWGLGEYKVRTVEGIERQVNIQSVTYALLCLLPYVDNAFAALRNLSIQERRYHVGMLIERQRFFADLVAKLKKDKNTAVIADHCVRIARTQTEFAHLGS